MNVTFFCCDECSLRAALAETQRLVPAALHLPHHEDPERQQKNKRNGVDQNGNPAAARFLVVVDVHALGEHGVVQILVDVGNDRMQLLVVVFIRAVQIVAADAYGLDLARVHIVHQLRVRELGVRARLGVMDYGPKQHHNHDDDHPEYGGLKI